MKKVVLLLILLIFLASCNVIQPKKEVADITGSDGLKLTLPKLPKELNVGQGLDIPITLENVGTHKVENGILSISGYDSNFVKFRTKPKVEGINLEGKSNFIPVGERRTEVFTISSVSLPDRKEKKEVFEAIACYQYQTIASPVVCINPKLVFGTTAIEAGCAFVDAKISPTQGAPVAVTKVETWYFSDKNEVEFRIFVKSLSKGGVILEQSAYAKRCLSPDPLKVEDIGVVNIEAFMSGTKLSCYVGENQVDRFKVLNDRYSVTCRAQINPSEPAFTTPLSIELSYGYNIIDVFAITLKNPDFGR